MRASFALPSVADVWVVRSRIWWDDRSGRERALLLGLATALLIWIAVAGMIRPVLQARETARAEIQLYDSLAVRLRAAGPTLKAPTGAATRSGPVQSIVTATAGEAALQIRQIDQQGAVTDIALDAVAFGQLIPWLDRLEREAGVTVAAAQIDRQTAPGVVNARLSLVRP